MVDLDLDIIMSKHKTLKLFDKDIQFRNVTMEEHLGNEFLIQELEHIPLTNKENVAKAGKIIQDYLVGILEIDHETAKKVSLDQYKKIRRYLERKDMYDQGFTDKEIDNIEKKALKKQMAQL
jgi:hypothetical protein